MSEKGSQYLSALVKEHAHSAVGEITSVKQDMTAAAVKALYDVADAMAAKVNEGNNKARDAFLDRWTSDIGEDIARIASEKSADQEGAHNV